MLHLERPEVLARLDAIRFCENRARRSLQPFHVWARGEYLFVRAKSEGAPQGGGHIIHTANPPHWRD